MSDIKAMAVKYWPWLVGGAVGLFVISRMGGSSGGSSNGYGAEYAGMQLESMRIGANSADTRYVADTQRAVAMYTTDADLYKSVATLEAEMVMAELNTLGSIRQHEISAMTNVNVAQIGAGVQSIYAYADVMRVMNEPTIAAMNSVTAQNIATINAIRDLGATAYEASAYVAGREFEAITRMTGDTAYYMGESVSITGPAWGQQTTQRATMPDMSWLTDIFGTIGKVATGNVL